MGYRESKNELLYLLLAGYPYIHVTTENETPVITSLYDMLDNPRMLGELKYEMVTFNLGTGFVVDEGFVTEHQKTPMKVPRGLPDNETRGKFKAALDLIRQKDANTILVLHDIDALYADKTDLVYDLKDAIQYINLPINENTKRTKRYENNKYKKHIIALSNKSDIPMMLNKFVNVMTFNMPGREEFRNIIGTFCTERQVELPNDIKEKIIEAGIGLTEPEFENAIFKSFVNQKGATIDPFEIVSLKEQIIKKGGLLEFSTPTVELSEVGGLDNLLDWVKKRELAFNEQLRKERKLSFPKGILMTGIPGCGKSYTVKAIAKYLGLPLLRLDTGSLMGKYVGDTESNTRRAIALAESIAPAVLWIDEIEKALPSAGNQNAHEVSTRMLSYFLTWLQEKKSEVFVVATANNIENLPPELLRKGRFSEIFFVDLPSDTERLQILKIHLKKVNATIDVNQLQSVVSITDGYSGAELEEIVQEANFQSAYDDSPLTVEYLLEEAKATTPLSVMMGDKIDAIKNWATTNRIRPASSPQTTSIL